MLYVGNALGGGPTYMSYLMDDVARTLASPMPRRKAFRYLAGTLLGGIFAPLAMAGACTSPTAQNGCDCTTAGQCSSGICSPCPTSQGGGSICVASGNKCCQKASGTGNQTDGVACSNSFNCCCGSTGTCAVSSGSTCNGPAHSGCWSI